MRPQVLLIERIFPDYKKPVYDGINDKVSLKFLHSVNHSGIKQITTIYSVPVKSWQYAAKETNIFLWAFNKILKYKPAIIIHELATGILSLPFVLLFSKIFRIKFILWGHAYNRKKGFEPGKKILDRYRLFLLKKADALIFYGYKEKELLCNYIKAEKIFVSPNTLDTPALIAIRNNLVNEGRENIKIKNGFRHAYNLIFVGRMLKDKQPEMLVNVYKLLKKKGYHSIGVYFVGDGEEMPYLKKLVRDEGLENDIIFYGPLHDNIKTGELLFSSDIMIMPGYLGLSVNHAFCFDCPVISFTQKENGPFHSPEVEYVINGKTGFLVDTHSAEALTEVVENFLNDTQLQKKMRSEIRYMIEEVCPLEKMVDGVMEAIKYVNNK